MGFLRDVFSEKSLNYLMKVEDHFKMYIYLILTIYFAEASFCLFWQNSVLTKACICLSTNIKNIH